MSSDKPKTLVEETGREDIDDSDQAVDTRKPSEADQAALSDKSGMLGEGDTNRRDSAP